MPDTRSVPETPLLVGERANRLSMAHPGNRKLLAEMLPAGIFAGNGPEMSLDFQDSLGKFRDFQDGISDGDNARGTETAYNTLVVLRGQLSVTLTAPIAICLIGAKRTDEPGSIARYLRFHPGSFSGG